jgi:FliA/WhiG family RNA polymerase sigma factor
MSKAAPKKEIKDVWIEYKKNKTEALRNVLMVNYLHLVRYNAERIHVKLPDEVELDDLMSAGIFGLMDAINAFDLDRGVKFETYCAPRIRGAILDELRSMDWVPRLVRSRAHKLDGASKQLEVELGRAPTNEEVAKRLKVSMAEFEKMAKDASAVGLVSQESSTLNGADGSGTAFATGIRITQIVMPGQKILIVEEQTPNDGCAFIATSDADDQLTNRHLKRGNQAFADGHVEMVLPEDAGFNTNHPNDTTFLNPVKRSQYCDLFFQP